MGAPLPPEVQAQIFARAQAMGWAQPIGAPPTVAPVPPPTPPAPIAPPPATQLPPATPLAVPNAAVNPGDARAHAPPAWRQNAPASVGADQTVGYSGAPSGGDAGAQSVLPPEPLTTTTSGSTVQKGVKLSSTTKAAEKEWLTTQAAADDLQDKGFQGARDAQRAGMRDEAAAIRANAAAGEIEANEHASDLSRKRSAIERGLNDVAKMQVDPDHWWHSRGTGQRLSAVIAMIGGGFLAGKNNGPNQAAEHISRLVDNDIAAQHANIANARADVQGRSQIYNMAASSFHDAEERHAAMRAMGLQAAQKEIDARVSQATDPIERAKLLETRAQVDREKVGTLASLDEKMQDKVSLHSTTSTQKGGPNPNAGGLPADRVVRGPDGRMFVVNSPEAAKKLQENNAVAARLQKNIALAKALRPGQGQNPLSEQHAKLESTVAEIKRDFLFLNGEKLRASGKMPEEMLDAAIGNPASMFEMHGVTRLDALDQSVKSGLADDYAAYGATPIDAGQLAIQGGKPIIMTPSVPVIPTGKKGR